MKGTVFIPPFTFMLCTTKSLLSHANHRLLGLICEFFLISFKFLTNFGHKVDVFLVFMEVTLMGKGNTFKRQMSSDFCTTLYMFVYTYSVFIVIIML
jgi:hypothetical protein